MDFSQDIDQLIVHRPPMRLLDGIVQISELKAVAAVLIKRDNPFFEEPHGLPAYCGLEMMAQTIAAIDGYRQLSRGLAPKIGFLLGSRKYESQVDYFREGAGLRIAVTMVFTDGQMFSFDGRVLEHDAEIGRANLNVYAPDSPDAFLDKVMS
jgi:predicted hotdog family 3-hydroxylacyl-ACP dehydratase